MNFGKNSAEQAEPINLTLSAYASGGHTIDNSSVFLSDYSVNNLAAFNATLEAGKSYKITITKDSGKYRIIYRRPEDSSNQEKGCITQNSFSFNITSAQAGNLHITLYGDEPYLRGHIFCSVTEL